MRMNFHQLRPTILIMAGLAYSLGAGIARYLGRQVNLAVFLLGLLACLSLLGAVFVLVEYFHLAGTQLRDEETLRSREWRRTRSLQGSFALFTLAGAAVISLLLAHGLPLEAALVLLLMLALLSVYVLPPMRLNDRGYGELVLAVTLATLLPALSFFLQYEGFHRLLPIVTFPITLLAIAWLLVMDFPTFSMDQKSQRGSLLTRLTWPRAVPLHHLLIVFAYLLLGAAPLTGVPWALVWPAFLAVPFYLIQMAWLQSIAQGGPTRWTFLTSLSTGALGLCVYLISMTFWTR